MISVLIPVHNYNIQDLISKLLIEFTVLEYDYEIICLDDCSSIPIIDETIFSNKVKVLKNDVNIGRTETRQKLAEKAKYYWLLFLDADTLPVSNFFISKYINSIEKNNFEVCFGGIAYYKKQPKREKTLRWKYGIKKEVITSLKRREKPYKTISSANLLVRKEVFIAINETLKGNYYGYDNIFSVKLKQKKMIISHIDNPVFHLGLEDNASYLRKKELAAETIFMSYINKETFETDNGLLKTYFFLKKSFLVGFVSIIFKAFRGKIKKNLLSSNPSILLLDFYRIGYFCSLNYDS